MKRQRILPVCAILCFALLRSGPAEGAALTWTTSNPANTVWTAAGVWDGPATWANGDSATFNNSPTVNLGTAISQNGVTIVGGQTLTLNLTADSKVTGTGGFSGNLIKTGGNLRLSHSGGCNGTLQANSNYLILGSNSADPTGQTSSLTKLIINGGGIIIGSAYNGLSLTVGELSGTSGSLRTDWTDGGTNNKRTLILDQSTVTTYAGTINEGTSSRSFELIKTGTGTLTLSGNNTGWSQANAIVTGGTLKLGHAAGIGINGSYAQGFTLRNGTFDINGQSNYTPSGGSPVWLINSEAITLGGQAGGVMTLQDTGATPRGFGLYNLQNCLTYDAANNPGTATISAPFYAVGGSGALTRTITVGDSTATSVELDFTGQLGQNVSSDGQTTTLQKAGDGTMRISAANYFPVLEILGGKVIASHNQALGVARSLANALTMSNGTLEAGGADRSFSTPVTLTAATANAVSGDSYNLTLSGVVSGSGALSKAGSATLTLSGPNTYTGTTTVNGGTLKAGVVSAAGVSGAFGNNAAISMADAAGAGMDITGYNTQIGSLTGGGGTGGNVILGAATLTVGGDGTSPAAYAGAISGSGGGIAKIGAGTLTLSGANAYTGATAVYGGALVAAGATALGDNSAVTITNGTLRLESNVGIKSLTSISGQTNGMLDLNSRTLTIGNATAGDSGALFYGKIASTGTILLRGGAYTIMGSDGAAGNNGNYQILVPVTAAMPTAPFALDTGTSATDRKDFAFINDTGDVLTLSSLTGYGAIRNDAGGSGDNTRYILVDQSGGDTVFNGALLSHRSSSDYLRKLTLEKQGTSRLTLAGFIGKATVGGNAGVSPVNLVANGGTLDVINPYNTTTVNSDAVNLGTVTLTSGTLAFANQALLNTAGSAGATSILLNGGTLQWDSGNTQDLSAGGRLTLVAAKTATFDSNGNNISFGTALAGGAISAALTKTGTGTLTLGGANSYTGVTTVNGGTLAISADGALGTAPGAATPGQLMLSGGTLAATASLALNSNRGLALGPAAGSGSGTLDVAASQSVTYGGICANNGAGTGGLTKGGSGTLTLTASSSFSGATSITGGTLKFTGSGALASTTDIAIGAGTVFEWGRDAAMDRTLSGSGKVLRSTTSGNATFSGANGAFNGSWEVTSGYVGLTSDSVVGAAAVGMTLNGGGIYFTATGNTLAATRTITLGASGGILNGAAGNSNTFAAQFTGSGNLTKVSGETAILTAANNYAGATIVQVGTLRVTGSGTLGGTAGSAADANNILFNGTSSNGALEFETAANLGPADQVRFRNSGGTVGQGGVLRYIGTTAQTVSKTIQCDTSIGIRLESDSVGGSVLFNGAFSQANRGLYLGGTGTGANTLSTAFTGSGGITKRDAGKWVLSGANTFSGNVAVNGGTLVFGIGGAGGVPNTSGPLGAGNTAVTKVNVAAGGTLDVNGYGDTGYGVTIAGDGSAGQGALINNGSSTSSSQIQTPNLTLSDNASIGGSGNFYMIASGYGANTLTMAAHTLTKLGSNTFSLCNTTVSGGGTIRISGGTLSQFSAASSASGTAFVLDDTAGVSLGLNNLALSVGSLSGGGSTGGNVALGSGTLTAGALNTTTTFSGAISGSGGITKTGSGTLSLAGGSAYTGSTIANGGALLAESNTAFGSETVWSVGGGTLDANGRNLSCKAFNGASGTIALGSGTVTVGSGSGANLAFTASLTGSGSFVKEGGFQQQLQGPSIAFSGTIYPNNGLLIINPTSGNLTGLPSFYFSSTDANDGVVFGEQFNGGTISIGSLAGTGTAAAKIRCDWGANGFRTLAVNQTVNGTFAGVIAQSSGSRDFALVKAGSGTLTLTGANTYAQGTTVSNGTLLVSNSSGSGLGSGAVAVKTGAVLGGTGSIGGLTTIESGGALAPGASAGTLTFSNGLTLAGGASLNLDLGPSSDLVRVTGGTLTGPAVGQVTIHITGSIAQGTTYTLMDWTGATASGVESTDFAVLLGPLGGVPHVYVSGTTLLLGVNTSTVLKFK